jgi:N-acetylmuramoyl-L-alanine amidase
MPTDDQRVIGDLHRRLGALGYSPDPDGSFGEQTIRELKKFQDRRGLVATGVCDQATWSALLEAGYRLGDRLLYLTRPMQRGDDIVTLQRRLGGLGFDAGRVDGILGPDTDRALREFQRNSGLVDDGVCGPATLDQLSRLGNRISAPAPVAGVRERQQLRDAPPGLVGRRVAVAHGGGVDSLAHALARHLAEAGADTFVVQHRDPSAVASHANTSGADVIVDLHVGDAPTWCAFYQSEDYESTGGRRLAELVSDALEDGGLEVVPARGLRLTTLRETRMPAIVVHLGPATLAVTQAESITRRCSDAVVAWSQQPIRPDE